MWNGHSQKDQKIGFQDILSLNAGQKYCRMLQGEHSAIVSAFIKQPFVINFFVLSIFEWLFYTGFTVTYPLKRQEKNASENFVCWSRLLQIIA